MMTQLSSQYLLTRPLLEDVIFGGKSLIDDSSNAHKRHTREVFSTLLGEKCLTPSNEIMHFSDADIQENILYPDDDSLVISIPIN